MAAGSAHRKEIAVLSLALLAAALAFLLHDVRPGTPIALSDRSDGEWRNGVQLKDPRRIMVRCPDGGLREPAPGDFIDLSTQGFREILAVRKDGSEIELLLRSPVAGPTGSDRRAFLLERLKR